MILFALPLVLGALLIEAVLLRTGEAWPVATAVARQSGLSEFLYGRQYFAQQFNLYKSAILRLRRPGVIALGSSRVMQFRDFLFYPQANSFYNCGGMIQTDADIAAFAEAVRSGSLPRPSVLILGIEAWWLKPETRRNTWIGESNAHDSAFRFADHVRAARAVLTDRKFPWWGALTGRINTSPAYHYPAFGLAALQHGDGERQDGSHLYTMAVVEEERDSSYRDREKPPVIERVRGSFHQFLPADQLDPARVQGLLSALETLRTAGTEVVTFEPPFSSVVLDALNEARAGWWVDYRDRLPDRLRADGFICLGVTCPKDFGLDDTYMLDGFHAGEVLDSYLLERLVQLAGSRSRLSVVDSGHLRRLRERPGVLPFAFDPPGATRRIGP